MQSLFILWDVDPEIFTLGGFSVRWYGLFFALSFFLGLKIMGKIYSIEGKSEKDLDQLAMYMIIAVVAGARLGHCLFYEPSYYLNNPLEILMIWKGGLASHGAATGILFALFLYVRKGYAKSYLWILDRIVIVVALAGCFIRFGNLTNSEIIGVPADKSYAFVFANPTERSIKSMLNQEMEILHEVQWNKTGKDTTIDGFTYPQVEATFQFDNRIEPSAANIYINSNIIPNLKKGNNDHQHIFTLYNQLSPVIEKDGKYLNASIPLYAIPRHPSQLYESISTGILFLILFGLYMKYKRDFPEGLSFGLFCIWVFSLRFLYEFIKENQVAMEESMTLNLGQKLSIPLILIGFVVLIRMFLMENKRKKEA